VQSQILSAGGLTLRARTEGLSAAKVERARLEDRSILLTWAMRGTLHLVAADDYGWLTPIVVEPQTSKSHHRLQQMGLTGDQPARGVRTIVRMLEREGPLTRAEIAERLRRLRISTEGQVIPHLTWLAASEMSICYGPDRGGKRCFVLVRDWIGEPELMYRDRALAELAVRYLRAHGPATPADLAFWSGIKAADVKRGWSAVRDRLAEVETPTGTMWTLRSRRKDEPAPPGTVRLLPSFDEYLLGWKDRAFVAPSQQWRKINPGAGWYHPAVAADGRAVGTWATERKTKTVRLVVRPFSHLSPAIRRGIAAEAANLADYLGAPVDLRFD
jgi:Winged helix DNA-binding domain